MSSLRLTDDVDGRVGGELASFGPSWCRRLSSHCCNTVSGAYFGVDRADDAGEFMKMLLLAGDVTDELKLLDLGRTNIELAGEDAYSIKEDPG